MSKRPSSAPKRDVYAEITDNIILAIEADPGKPTMPWRQTGGLALLPTNALSKNHYNGINILSLWAAAATRNFPVSVWGTYKQWAELGCQVRKGEKSSPVIFYKEFTVDAEEADDDGKRRVARASRVFNAAQVDGYELPPPPEDHGPIERMQAADQFLSRTGADIRHGGQSAYYHPSGDYIQMPDEGLFTGTDTMTRSESYYATALHECVHWSGGKARLDRDLKGRFGDDAYAAEELIAEIGAAFLTAELGITQDTRADHAQYLAHWLTIMKGDKKAIFTASAKAAEAATFLKSLQGSA